MEDIVAQLGYLTLGSRFKRIGERMQADVLRLTERAGMTVQTGQFPLLAALDRNGPLTVGGLASAVGFSQPSVTRNVNRLVDMGLVEMTRVHRDQRHKTVALTPEGQRIVEYSRQHVWPRIEAAVMELCAGLDGSLLDQLAAIEEGLAEAPLDRRGPEAHAREGRPV